MKYPKGPSPEEGSTLVEFALILPVFFLLLFGLIQVALALFAYGNVTYACRAATRYASLHSSSSVAPATQASISAIAQPFLVAAPAANTSISTTWSGPSQPGTNAIGNTVQVSIRITLPLTIPFTHTPPFSVSSTAQRTITR